jgi:septal ring factor EnvC (AmiA/AmiB activator)
MAEQIKFTDDEIGQVNQLRQDVSSVFVKLGELAIQKKQTLDEINTLELQLHETHSELVKREDELFKSLNQKYGDGNYDPNTGIFTPIVAEEKVS